MLEQVGSFLERGLAQVAAMNRKRLAMFRKVIVVGVARFEHRRAKLTEETMLIAVQMFFQLFCSRKSCFTDPTSVDMWLTRTMIGCLSRLTMNTRMKNVIPGPIEYLTAYFYRTAKYWIERMD